MMNILRYSKRAGGGRLQLCWCCRTLSQRPGVDSALVLLSDFVAAVPTNDPGNKHGVLTTHSQLFLSNEGTAGRSFTEETPERRHPRATTAPMIDHLRKSKEYPDEVKSRIEHLRRFLPIQFVLLKEECLAVLCGHSDVEVNLHAMERDRIGTGGSEEIEQPTEPRGQHPFSKSGEPLPFSALSLFSSQRAQILGAGIVDAYLALSTLFADEAYLSVPAEDLEPVHNIFNDRLLIPQFMRRNQIYDCLIPFRGSRRACNADAGTNIREIQGRIRDETAVASFHTLVGLLSIKYGQRKVAESLILPIVVNGPRGLIRLATEKATRKTS